MATEPTVAIIDYGLGNVASVHNALSLLGVSSEVTSDPEKIAAATHLILPGVGSFSEGMAGLKQRGLIPILQQEVLEKKKKILGICLGMQLFATKSFEHGEHEGLNFISGQVVQIDTSTTGYRLPQIGWNNMTIIGKHSITHGFENEPIFYFVHSYHFVPEDSAVIVGTCDYGYPLTALIAKDNIIGAQFHPEKSHDDGMRILTNFLELPHA